MLTYKNLYCSLVRSMSEAIDLYDAGKGAILSRERMAPLNPQENARGGPLDPRHCRSGA